MRVIGRTKLSAIADVATPKLRGSILALNAELECADWTSAAAAAVAFPAAQRAGHRLLIDLDGEYRAEIGVNFEAGIVVVEYVGRSSDRSSSVWQDRSRSA